MRRALVSVYDKTGLVPFVERLVAAGVEVVSSGGTADVLTEAGVPVTPVAKVTGFPEMLGGRVKTLHPAIHAGILADVGDLTHLDDLARHGIEPFQLVVGDLYPFEETVADPGVTEPEAVEQIDIGGPAMIRAAAKNHAHVAVVTSPDDYDLVAGAVEGGGIDAGTRRRLATAAFARTAAYDAAIVAWMQRHEPLPVSLVLAVDRVEALRYGENPHQGAALYRERGRTGWWHGARRVLGKPMSFNNLVDAEAAWRLVNRLDEPAAVIVKHTNPCGVAVRPDGAAAFAAAWECDPVSAFGGVVAVNTAIEAPTATLLAERFVEVVVAPQVDGDAAGILATKPNVRVLEAAAPHGDDLDLRRLEDGFVAQRRQPIPDADDWVVRSVRQPDAEQLADLALAWQVAAAASSNAIAIVTGRSAVGIGAGEQSRVGAAARAVAKAGQQAQGASAAGDGFFPFPDGIETLAQAGVTAVVAPGGSRGDPDVIATADRLGIVLILAGTRHFRH
ncbi:MAG: bifunctional phosphoribosylaminoimidazolecarboxamide formyltransferase/IMP cyclohydrolase [Acidimicrobiia bacterium]|nr:bifunctional phosphoribosylaminoimidazolecarboxamide formyltransferase/IMP cyclohydrolase [Acidimicrobiia bacterium]